MRKQLMLGMKPGAIRPGDFSEGSGVEGRGAKTKEEPPASPGADPEPESKPTRPRKKTNFRGSGRLNFNDGGDAGIFDSTRP
jgi:hypothetical protein